LLTPFLPAGLFAQIIIVILFVMSVVSWAIFIRKWRTLRKATVQTRTLLNQL